uniref:probable cardiolipin synthase (CMP-forming) n=1 Tax=Styela clava TaxID=7725 RepID=UPI0019399C39|nr:probable cardiolipin synthase (CMP-forming) [Styela clava]
MDCLGKVLNNVKRRLIQISMSKTQHLRQVCQVSDCFRSAAYMTNLKHVSLLCGQRHNASTSRNARSAKLLFLNMCHRNFGCYSVSLQRHQENNQNPETVGDAKDKWESLLDNDEKRENIASIPTRKENIFTVPNLLSFSRIVATPYIAYLVLEGNYIWATAGLIIAGITDILDGQIARRWPSQKSAFGTALDPLGDKILITVLTVTLAKANLLPLPLAVLIVGRDVLLILAVFYLRYRTCPPPLTLKRYFDPTLVNTKLNPTTISKVNTVLQVAIICMAISAPIFELSQHPALYGIFALTGLTTIWSGLDYIFNKNTVQILKEPKLKDGQF